MNEGNPIVPIVVVAVCGTSAVGRTRVRIFPVEGEGTCTSWTPVDSRPSRSRSPSLSQLSESKPNPLERLRRGRARDPGWQVG